MDLILPALHISLQIIWSWVKYQLMFLRVHSIIRNPKALQKDFIFSRNLWIRSENLVSVRLSLTGSIIQLAPLTSKHKSQRHLLKQISQKDLMYRLSRVKKVKVKSESPIRTIVLEYKLPNDTMFHTVSQPIWGVSVIVVI